MKEAFISIVSLVFGIEEGRLANLRLSPRVYNRVYDLDWKGYRVL